MIMKTAPRCHLPKVQVEKFKEIDSESVPATTISMGTFLTTYLRGDGVAADARPFQITTMDIDYALTRRPFP